MYRLGDSPETIIDAARMNPPDTTTIRYENLLHSADAIGPKING
jgi:hypothetical protein